MSIARERAERLASGYAWGREDESFTKTATTDDRDGSYLFAQAFAAAQDDYDQGQRGMMTNVRDAYTRWQETGGRTIEAGHGFEAHLLKEARGWIADCFEYTDVDPDSLTDQAVRRGIDRHYEGGWAGFRHTEQESYYAPRQESTP